MWLAVAVAVARSHTSTVRREEFRFNATPPHAFVTVAQENDIILADTELQSSVTFSNPGCESLNEIGDVGGNWEVYKTAGMGSLR